MDSVNIHRRDMYGNIPSNEYQQTFIKKHENLPLYSSAGYELVDVPSHIFKCILQKHTRAVYVPERKTTQEFEDVVIRSYSDIPSYVCNNMQEFSFLGRALKPVLESWIGKPLKNTAVYGPRMYTRGAILLNHVDKSSTHVISATLTIEEKVDTPWFLTCMCDTDVVEVDIAPGKMLLYEGARLPHARPHPLDGEYYVNIYIHFNLVETS
jgi:hypothetical protein